MSDKVPFSSYSMQNASHPDRVWFDWCVFVDPSFPMEKIRSVEYLLHPTFPDPLRTISDPSSCFGLFSSGWGEFQINIRIEFTDGFIGNQKYYLHLSPVGWPKGQEPQIFISTDEQKVYRAMKGSQFRWRKLDTICKNSGLNDQTVARILDGFEKQNIARKAYFRAVDGEDLWGTTDVVGLSPRPD